MTTTSFWIRTSAEVEPTIVKVCADRPSPAAAGLDTDSRKAVVGGAHEHRTKNDIVPTCRMMLPRPRQVAAKDPFSCFALARVQYGRYWPRSPRREVVKQPTGAVQ